MTGNVDTLKTAHVTPLKQRYAERAMTVCIAGTFRWNENKHGIVLCADGRLDGGTWGHSDVAVKYHTLGYNWFGMMAGHWSTARELCSHIERDQRGNPPPDDLAEVRNRLQASADFFASSALYDGDVNVIVSGFIRKKPHLLRVAIEDGLPSVKVVHDMDAIGEGAHASLMMLTYRGYDALNSSITRACYVIYEAKKFSENLSSVGPKTRIKIHLPVRADLEPPAGRLAVDQTGGFNVTAEAMARLEEMRQRFFLQPVEDFEFPTTYLE